MKSDSRAQQREQERLLATICQTLKDEHEAKQQRLQKDTTQVWERQKEDIWLVVQRRKKADPVRFVVAGKTEAGDAAGTGREWATKSDARRKREQL